MIAILGAGAMGSVFGGRLAEAGEDVVLIARKRDHVEEINSRGLRIEGVGGYRRIGIRAFTSAQEVGRKADLIFLFVKSYSTEDAMIGSSPIVGEETMIVTLQNGLGNAEKIAEFVGEEKVIAGTTSGGATLLGPGHVRHVALGETVLGPLRGRAEKAEPVASVLRRAGFPTSVTERVEEAIWGKLLINAGINPLTAILRVRNGQLLLRPSALLLMKMAVEEGLEVCKARGIELGFDPMEKCIDVVNGTRENISSMYQDVMRENITEIDYINGAIVREGKGLGIKTRVNEILVALIKAIEEGYP
jgi:2-dehydropantoate 2-reductase